MAGLFERAHGFVDGAYIREAAKSLGVGARPNPHGVVEATLQAAGPRLALRKTELLRVSYYDAEPDPAEPENPDLEAYWRAIAKMAETQLRFGYVRGKPSGKGRRQKGVDVQLAVDMLAGAVDHIFSTAILIAGDLDFLPLIHEVQRRGVTIVLGAFSGSLADELTTEPDRFVPLAADALRGQI